MELENTKHCTTNSTRVIKSNVPVGGDIIENVEYYIFSHDWWPKKEAKTFKDRLEYIWYTITTPYYRIKNKARDLYWEIRYGFQRMFNGYDSVDVFNTFDKFIERYNKILTRYKNTHCGYPGGDITEEAWENIIDEMLYHLKYMDEETVTEELEKDVPDDWSASGKTVYEIMEKHKDEFFTLFSKYFYNLWD